MTGGLVTALVTALEERSAGGAGAAELAPERRPGGQIGGSRAGARQAAVARSPRDERLFGASGDGMANGYLIWRPPRFDAVGAVSVTKGPARGIAGAVLRGTWSGVTRP